MDLDRLIGNVEEALPPTRVALGEGWVEVEPEGGLEVARLLRIAEEHGITVSLPWDDAPLRISPKRMASVLELDKEARVIRVQTGIRWEDLEAVARSEGMTTGVIPPSRLTVLESIVKGIEPPGVPFTGSGRALVSTRWAFPGSLSTLSVVKARAVGPKWEWALFGRRGLAIPVEALISLLPMDMVEVRHMEVDPQELVETLAMGSVSSRNVVVRDGGGYLLYWIALEGKGRGEAVERLGPWGIAGYELRGGSRACHPIRARLSWNCDFRGAFVPEDEGVLADSFRIK